MAAHKRQLKHHVGTNRVLYCHVVLVNLRSRRMVRVVTSALSIEAGRVGRGRSVRQWLAGLQVRADSAEQSHRRNAVGLVAVASLGTDRRSHAGAISVK